MAFYFQYQLHLVQGTYQKQISQQPCPQIESLQVTWAWFNNEDLRWWMEATAVWAEPKVEPRSGSYPRQLEVLLSNPQQALIKRPLDNAGPSYGEFIFPTFLEQKVAAPRTPPGAPQDIILKVWNQYAANSTRGMVDAIDTVLRRPEYNTNLVDAFPNFTWNNYFLNRGTYDRRLNNIYRDVENPGGGPVSMDEWELFRSWLQGDRLNHLNGNAGVLIERASVYPWNASDLTVNQLGAQYIEFLARDNNPNPPNAQTVLNVTLTTSRPTSTASRDARVSVLPIIDFVNGVHPANTFVMAQPVSAFSSSYSFRVHNFGQCGRVALVVNDVSPDFTFMYNVTADVVVPAVPATNVPCSLQVLP